MGYLTAAVVVVGALCLLNLILLFGIIRRLREHSQQLSQAGPGLGLGLGPGLGPGPAGGVPVGQQVADFTATTTAGEQVARERLTAPTLVGFFSPGCEPCAEQLPHFVRQARGLPGDAGRALAVVVGAPDEAGDPTGRDSYVEQLAPVANVVVEDHGGPVQTAFEASGFPMLYLLGPGGVVTASGYTVAGVADPAVVTSGATS